LVLSAIIILGAEGVTTWYADRLMPDLALIVFIVFTYNLLKEFNLELYLYLPLILMVIAIACWFVASKLIMKQNLRH
jgi:hypothetical protein